MAMIAVDIIAMRGKKTLELPETWEELTREQFLRVVDVLYNKSVGGIRLQTKLFVALSGLDRGTLLFIGAENIEKMLPLTEFLLVPATFTKQLLPYVRVKGVDYYGPYESLSNIRLCEQDRAERELYGWRLRIKELGVGMDDANVLVSEAVWTDKEALEHMYRFMAVLYRPGKPGYDKERDPDGDMREMYNDNLTHYYATIFRDHLPLSNVKAVLLWYKSCRDFMYSLEEFKPLFDSSNQSEIEGEVAYFGMTRAIAKEGAYGDFDKVEQMLFWNVLHELKHNKEEYEKMQQQFRQKELTNEF